jgi:N,N'-diacetyllegionaminate synthase
MNKTIKIIAEVGVNHNGSLKLAIKYLDACKRIGVDYVKFQLAIPNLVVTSLAKKATYQINKHTKNESQLDMLKKIHLSLDDYSKLNLYAKRKKIKILFSAFDSSSFIFLLKLKPNIIKIPSGEIDNFILLRYLKNYKGEVIVSTGMANIRDIKNNIQFLRTLNIKNKQITLMHCNSGYPTPLSDVNLNFIDTLKSHFKLNVGYSDHTIDDLAAIAATVKKCNYLEKHITFNTNSNGPDHKSSMNFKNFKKMIEKIRNTEILLGSNQKVLTKSESKNINIVRKFLVATKDIKKNEIFDFNNINSIRCGGGISPSFFLKFIGKKSNRTYKINDKIKI